MPVLRLPGNGQVTQWYGEYPTAGPAYADPSKEAVRLDLLRTYGNYQPAGHDGVDVAANLNDPVFAMASGRVLYAGRELYMPASLMSRIGVGGIANDPQGMGPGGNVVYIELDSRYIGYTAHQNSVAVSTGQMVSAGQVVGGAGTTGRSGGVHIHWAVIDTLNITSYAPYGRINPMQFVPSRALLIGGADPIPDLYAD